MTPYDEYKKIIDLEVQQDNLVNILKSAIDTLKTVADNCQWLHSDFPVIARAEHAIEALKETKLNI